MYSNIVVGHRSDGDTVSLNLSEVSPLFITYPDRRSWYAVLQSVAASIQFDSNVHWFLYLRQSGLTYWQHTADTKKYIETYIIDDPGMGTLTNRKKFLRAILKSNKQYHAFPKKKNPSIQICIIDDIWEMIRKSDRSDAQKIAALMRNTQDRQMCIIAGSSAGHRTLFPELLNPRQTEPDVLSTGQTGRNHVKGSATELILCTEGLVFRAHPGGQIIEKWYAPIPLQTNVLNSYQPEAPSNVPSPSHLTDADATEIVPENAQVFLLEG